MLSRGGGAIAFQKVVSKVSDLPSPLDAEPGTRIVVRETEEVYGLNASTRMWEVIGTLKKVGGKKPEELAAHVDSEGNPHKTSLQNVLDTGAKAKVDGEILITGKGVSQVRLLSGSSGLRVGPDAGAKSGALWLNIGSGKKTILRAVNSDGDDMFVVDTDGLVSGGSATFYGGFKGPAHFEDEITASEGVRSADGYDLVLGGDKGVLLKVGGAEKALLTKTGLSLKGGLTLKDLHLNGQVDGDLIPSKSEPQLGADKARWAAHLSSADIAGQLKLHVAANSQEAPLKVTGPVPGDAAVLTAGGALGLGTETPEARLDVRGDVLVDGGLRLNKQGLSVGDWSTSYSNQLIISHKGKTVFKGGSDGASLPSSKVEGDLVVTGRLALGGVSGLSGEEIEFKNGTAAYKAKSHSFEGSLKVSGDVSLPGVEIEGGHIRAKGNLKAANADLSELSIGSTLLKAGGISAPGEFEVDAPALATKGLRLTGSAPQVEVLEFLKLKGSAGSAEFNFGGSSCGLSFKGKSWELLGVAKLDAGSVGAKSLQVDGGATFCGGKAEFSSAGLRLDGGLNVGGLALSKVQEELELNGLSAQTRFKIPAGVRVEAVLLKLQGGLTGARFIQAGDDRDQDRFLTPTTDLKGGTLLRGLAHWDRGQVVQKHESPVVVSADSPTVGKILVTIHYVDPAAL